MRTTLQAWWSREAPTLLAALGSRPQGLTGSEAARRLADDGPNEIVATRAVTSLQLLARQFASPLTLILVFGAALSLMLREWVDAMTLVVVIVASAGLTFSQELRASRVMEGLRSRLALTSRVRRDGAVFTLPARELVVGDVIELAAGNLIPADGVILEARDFLVNESSLTGESFPVEKVAGTAAPDAPLAARNNSVFLGSSAHSGTARVLLTATGRATLFTEVAAHLGQADVETAFDQGVRQFGDLLLRVMLGVVVLVLMANQLLGRPVVESALFAAALAVGISPELLPAIVSVSLARGAHRLAQAGVLVRRLSAIEDLGSIETLCTDKTGTLTIGRMALESAVDPMDRPSQAVMRDAWLNAAFETGIDNPIDAALTERGHALGFETSGWTKIDEIPYDFSRRRLTIVVAEAGRPGTQRLICKGAFEQVLRACGSVAVEGGTVTLDDTWRARLESLVRTRGAQGTRVLALATAKRAPQARWCVGDEADLVFTGFLCFADPPRPDVATVVRSLDAAGVRVKIITGDNRHVAAHVAERVGLDRTALLTGAEIARMRDEALWVQAQRTAVFAEVDPMQKERIVRALRHRGASVGYLGDGINDAPALHAADVGISVNGAADAARESADIVLLAPELDLLRRGIEEGRRTFANTLKYIYITTSANFGNMVSMAVATPLLPFLPLTAAQILLNNLLSDLPSMAISTDRVDADSLARAPHWDVAGLRRFMILFGLISTMFDLLTFVLLRAMFEADVRLFHTAWFVLSVLTELVVLFLLRTRQPSWRSRPGATLATTAVLVAVLAMALPEIPSLRESFGFRPLPLELLAALLAVVAAYAAATEAAKHWFFRRLRDAPTL